MQGKYLVVDPRNPESLKQLSRAITAWDPLLSLRFSSGESLYGGILVCYGLSIGGPTRLAYRDRRQPVEPGDAIVMPPSVRVASQPAADFLWMCYEGLAPEHLRGADGIALGFEHFSLATAAPEATDRGRRRRVLPTTDLRHRLHYHFVEAASDDPLATIDGVQLHYVRTGEGDIRIGPALDQLAAVAVRAGTLVAIGPGVSCSLDNGLGVCTWFLASEMAHRRRVREAAGGT
jgi:hypothetical protein